MADASAAVVSLFASPGAARISGVGGTELSDGELIERIGGGDRGAFEQLYVRYSRSIFRVAMRRLGDRARAEDAVQEAFAAVWRSAASYRVERGPGAPWLYAVARNAIVDRARGSRELPGDVPETASGEAGPPERAETDWLRRRVHGALELLPQREREVISLAYWSGLSQSEVADSLGVPLGTVKTRTRAALARLAEILEGEDV